MDPVQTKKTKESLIGKVFADRFKVTGFLGEGGMGRIYLAEQTDMAGRQVALKVLHLHLGGEVEVVARFEREMKASTRIEHPNSVRVYEFGKADDRLFLVMEFVDGDSLGEVLLEDGAFGWQRVANIGRQIAAALAAAHAHGIVHRDLKPDNVMIGNAAGQRDLVKVCDFGLARFVGGEEINEDEDTDFKTAVGIRVGTPHYMPPEYITDFETDHRGDLYALGVLMYEMATGGPPFDGRPYEVLDAHVNKKAEPPSKRNRDIPGWLDAVILHLLEKDPAKRPQVAEEVIVMLERDRNRAGFEDAPTEEAGRPNPAMVEKGRKATLVLAAIGFATVLLMGAGVVACAGIGLAMLVI